MAEREQSAAGTLGDGREGVAATDDATRRSGVPDAGLKFCERARLVHLSGAKPNVAAPVALERLLITPHATRHCSRMRRRAIRSARDEGGCAASYLKEADSRSEHREQASAEPGRTDRQAAAAICRGEAATSHRIQMASFTLRGERAQAACL